MGTNFKELFKQDTSKVFPKNIQFCDKTIFYRFNYKAYTVVALVFNSLFDSNDVPSDPHNL